MDRDGLLNSLLYTESANSFALYFVMNGVVIISHVMVLMVLAVVDANRTREESESVQLLCIDSHVVMIMVMTTVSKSEHREKDIEVTCYSPLI